jgi:type I restriction enzyme, S subunit
VNGLPKQWQYLPLKAFGILKGGSGFPDESQGQRGNEIPFFKVKALERSSFLLSVEHADDTITRDAARSLGATIFPAGSIVFAKVGAALLLARFRVLSAPSCIDNNMMAFRVRPTEIHPRFAWYALSLLDFSYIVNPGAVPSINAGQIGMQRLPVPPLDMQAHIVDFLDDETAGTDGLVSKYERLIDLLEEKRVALISDAVTKGLDPNALMQESGLEWIDSVPERWQLSRLKFCVSKIGSGVTPRGGAESYVTDGVAFLRSQNVYDEGLRLDDVAYISQEVDNEMSRTRLQRDDVLLNITGASIGRTCIVPQSVLPANVNQHVCIVRPSYAVVPKYLSYALKSRSVREQIFGGENGSSREGLNYKQVGDLWIALPASCDEQAEIVAFLDDKTRTIDSLKADVEKAIMLLGEHRAALVAAAITGQINVPTYSNSRRAAAVA